MSEDETRDRRARTPREELLGSALSALMALQFAVVVMFGKQIAAGELPFPMLAIRFFGQSALLFFVLLVLSVGALAITGILATAVGRGRRILWTAAAVVGACALFGNWLLPAGIPLTRDYCGPSCGSGTVFMPAAAAVGAAGAAGVLSIRHRWASRRRRRTLAFIVSFLILSFGVQLWIA